MEMFLSLMPFPFFRPRETSGDATTVYNGPYDANQLYDHHVEGEDVGVAHRRAGALLPPPLETQVDDVDAEREDEEEEGDDERCDAEDAG
ncbi:hypothetical protein EYF80_051683 [Liparis tanakae]|uniref:Uncharacterized protein n=1 Tax=Liparis tanakae TaxID=230148 RepID=A0A4Z2FB35_9TELE|nr:hypothetical protein EYF80_051683 [Liparis tanakae]